MLNLPDILSSGFFWETLPIGMPCDEEFMPVQFPISDTTRYKHYTIKTREIIRDSFDITIFDEGFGNEGQLNIAFTTRRVHDRRFALRFHYSAINYLNELGF